MRKCLRCGAEMKEDCAILVGQTAWGITLAAKPNALFGGRIGEPRVAVCPECGEVSMYLTDVSQLK